MRTPRDAVLLRIFVNGRDRFGYRPLHDAIVMRAREKHLAGAVVLRGPLGFGRSGRLHAAKLLRLANDLPLVIEIVDSEEKIQAFLPELETMMSGGLVMLESVRVLRYGKPTLSSSTL